MGSSASSTLWRFPAVLVRFDCGRPWRAAHPAAQDEHIGHGFRVFRGNLGLLHPAAGSDAALAPPHGRCEVFFTRTVGFGFAYWYERLDVDDFSTIDANGSVAVAPATGTVRVDYLGALITGYGARPYRGNTASVRLLYLFSSHGQHGPHGSARVVRGRTDRLPGHRVRAPCGPLHLQAGRRHHDQDCDGMASKQPARGEVGPSGAAPLGSLGSSLQILASPCRRTCGSGR